MSNCYNKTGMEKTTMSISKKLYMGFGIIILFLLINSSLAYYQLHHINKLNNVLFEDRVYKLSQVNKILNASSLQTSYLRSYIIEPNEVTIQNFEKQERTVHETLEELDQIVDNELMQKELQIIKRNQSIFENAAQEIINTYNPDDLQAAIDIMKQKVRPADEAIEKAVYTAVEYQSNQMETTREEMANLEDVSSLIILIIALVSFILALIIAYFIARAITTSVNKLANAANVIAAGDLRQEDVKVTTKDEVRNLADSFNSMKANLHSLIDNVAMNVEHTTSSAEELAASTDEIALSANAIAKRVEIMAQGSKQALATGQESSVAMDETASGVQRIAEATQMLHSKAINTQAVANEGEKTLKTTENQMMIIQQSSHETNELIKQLSAQSIEIENISNVITDITDQTNLLALNATIEAARAGEHGQGFAVVADQVRKLAEESKVSANQIISLTTHIQQNTKEVEKAVSVTVQNVDEGVTYIQNAQTSFNDILDAVEKMASEIEDVSASTQQISASTEEVAASVNEMASVASTVAENTELIANAFQEQTATIQEISAVAKSLSDGATTLQEEINKFKV